MESLNNEGQQFPQYKKKRTISYHLNSPNTTNKLSHAKDTHI